MKKKYLSPESAETPLFLEAICAESKLVNPGEHTNPNTDPEGAKSIWNREGWLDKSSANE